MPRPPPLIAAIKKKNLDEVVNLVNGGADLEEIGPDTFQESVLFEAIKCKDPKILDVILKRHRKGGRRVVDINRKNAKTENTPLHWAVINMNLYAVESLLLCEEIKVNEHNKNEKNTPLHLAVQKNHVDVVWALAVHPQINFYALNFNNCIPENVNMGGLQSENARDLLKKCREYIDIHPDEKYLLISDCREIRQLMSEKEVILPEVKSTQENKIYVHISNVQNVQNVNVAGGDINHYTGQQSTTQSPQTSVSTPKSTPAKTHSGQCFIDLSPSTGVAKIPHPNHVSNQQSAYQTHSNHVTYPQNTQQQKNVYSNNQNPASMGIQQSQAIYQQGTQYPRSMDQPDKQYYPPSGYQPNSQYQSPRYQQPYGPYPQAHGQQNSYYPQGLTQRNDQPRAHPENPYPQSNVFPESQYSRQRAQPESQYSQPRANPEDQYPQSRALQENQYPQPCGNLESQYPQPHAHPGSLYSEPREYYPLPHAQFSSQCQQDPAPPVSELRKSSTQMDGRYLPSRGQQEIESGQSRAQHVHSRAQDDNEQPPCYSEVVSNAQQYHVTDNNHRANVDQALDQGLPLHDEHRTQAGNGRSDARRKDRTERTTVNRDMRSAMNAMKII